MRAGRGGIPEEGGFAAVSSIGEADGRGVPSSFRVGNRKIHPVAASK